MMLFFPQTFCDPMIPPPPSGTDGVISYLSLPDPAVPLLQRRHFDLQTHLPQEEHSQEKANGVEMLREQGEFEWGSFSFSMLYRGKE